MIEVFKILNKFDKINPEILIEMNNASVTRDTGMQLKDITQLLVSHTSMLDLLTIGTDSQHQ